MVLYHATLASNLPSIMENGFDPRFSQGKLAACWFHVRGRREWAMLHTVKRHGGRVENVVILEVKIPRSWLVRSHAKGMWCCKRVVPAIAIKEVVSFTAVAKSPLEV